jgi:hypothetical protein
MTPGSWMGQLWEKAEAAVCVLRQRSRRRRGTKSEYFNHEGISRGENKRSTLKGQFHETFLKV